MGHDRDIPGGTVLLPSTEHLRGWPAWLLIIAATALCALVGGRIERRIVARRLRGRAELPVEQLAADLEGAASLSAKCAAWNEVARLLRVKGGLMRADDEARLYLVLIGGDVRWLGLGGDLRWLGNLGEDLEDHAIHVPPGAPLEPQLRLRPDVRVGEIASWVAYMLDAAKPAA
jgi:hypothetical protein